MLQISHSRILNLTPLFAIAAMIAVSDVAHADVYAQANSGERIGVGILRVRLDSDVAFRRDVRMFELNEDNQRTLYPVYSQGSTRPDGKSISVHFLFRGDEPLKITLKLRNGDSFRQIVTPSRDANGRRKLLAGWWKHYKQWAAPDTRSAESPNVLEGYLVAMLGRRLMSEVPAHRPRRWSPYQVLDQAVGLLTGAGSVRAAMQRKTFLEDTKRTEKADLALPKAVAPPAVQIPPFPADVKIEPMAMHVPADCFYIRCGSYSNFRWLRTNIDEWGSRLRDLVAVRGLDFRVTQNIERQLALKETALALLFGNTVISDVAVIGADTFVREGAAIGVIFEAKNNIVLRMQLEKLRSEAARQHPEAAMRSIRINGHDVKFLSTPDNRIRSFYAVDGRYHLVTNSRTIARGFLQAGAGKDSLGKLKEFRHARNIMPLSRKDSAFIYLSDPFFRRLVGPHYRVEMTRRMQAVVEIEMVEMARLAAAAEKSPNDRIGVLVDGRILPDNFATRPDGSQTDLKDAVVTDSLRGARGTFLPIPDVTISGITASEQRAYEKFAGFYRQLWQRVDPVIIGVKRQFARRQRERVTFDVHITPYIRQHLGILVAVLAPPDKKRIAPVDGDLIAVQVQLGSNILGSRREIKEDSFRAFVALRDFKPKFTIVNGRVVYASTADTPMFYLGATPPVALLFYPKQTAKPDADGYVHIKTGSLFARDEWIRTFDNFHVRAKSKAILQQVTPKLKLDDAPREAQLRMRIGDLSQTQLAAAAHAFGYMQSRKTSANNTRLLHQLSEQLNIPPKDARKHAEAILDARMTCPLGGEYQLKHPKDGFPQWHSTAWGTGSLYDVKSIPDGYRFPFLEWFRGLDLEFNIDRTTLKTRIELELNPGALRK